VGPAPCGDSRLPPTTVARARATRRPWLRFFTACLALVCGILPRQALAQLDPDSRQLPQLGPPALVNGVQLESVWLVPDVGQARPERLQSVNSGDVISAAQVRGAMRELLDTGQYASVRSELVRQVDGRVRLLLFVEWRKIVAGVEVHGGELESAQVADALGLRNNQELTQRGLDEAAARVRLLYVERGFPLASVSGAFNDGAEPSRAIVTITVAPGPPALVAGVRVHLPDKVLPEASMLAGTFGLAIGQRLDQVELNQRKRALEERFRARGYLRATVDYRVNAALEVDLTISPKELIGVRYEGLRAFDRATLRAEVEESEGSERTVASLEARLLAF
jgi:outer membrane protein assembly factor BamA